MNEIDKGFAKEVDGRLAALLDSIYDVLGQVGRYRDLVKNPSRYWSERQVESYRQQLVKYEQELDRLRNLYDEEEKNYSGWSRAFLVVNSNGHIHSSRSCSTCYDSTKYVWLTQMSGESRLEIAELAGEKACTVCYPDAPSEYFQKKCQLEDPKVVAARKEREEKAEKKRQEQEVKGIKDLDGSDLKVEDLYGSRYRTPLNTLRSAEIWVVDAMVFLANVREHQKSRVPVVTAEVERVMLAIANKKGETFDQVLKQFGEKVEKKLKKIERETEKWLAQNPQYR